MPLWKKIIFYPEKDKSSNCYSEIALKLSICLASTPTQQLTQALATVKFEVGQIGFLCQFHAINIWKYYPF